MFNYEAILNKIIYTYAVFKIYCPFKLANKFELFTAHCLLEIKSNTYIFKFEDFY